MLQDMLDRIKSMQAPAGPSWAPQVTPGGGSFLDKANFALHGSATPNATLAGAAKGLGGAVSGLSNPTPMGGSKPAPAAGGAPAAPARGIDASAAIGRLGGPSPFVASGPAGPGAAGASPSKPPMRGKIYGGGPFQPL